MKKTRSLIVAMLSLFVLSSCAVKEGKDTTISIDGTTETSETAIDPTGKSFHVYALNDFHGAVEKDDEDGRMGLANMGTFFKNKGAEPNTIILDQGDTWQGSIYSNMNYGAVVDDVMSYARFDARTVGNHDFDWGLDHIKDNTARSYGGYRVPVLAANIYDYNFETKQFGNTQQSDIGQRTTTITLENGLKIGVVGVIGSGQITSINSQYTHDIGFKDHVAIAKQEATRLRQEGCNFVICSIHGGQEDLIGNDMKDYVDLVLCGHTHKDELFVEDEALVYMQAKDYGKAWGEFHATFVNKEDYEAQVNVKWYVDHPDLFTTVDPTIQSIIDGYNSQTESAANEIVAADVNGLFDDYHEAANLMAKAIMDETLAEGYNDVVISYVNQGRNDLSSGRWTFADVYQTFPFDNKVYIMEISGADFEHEVGGYNWICKNPSFDNKINPNETYKIAVLDYLGFHTNEARYYDYFPSANGQYSGILQNTYRPILKNWLINNHYADGTYTLNASDFASNVERHNKSTIQYIYPEHTITFELNGGSISDPSQLTRVGHENEYYSAYYPNPDPTKDNYFFDGWYLDNNTFNYPANGKKIISDRILYAKWISEDEDCLTITNSSITNFDVGTQSFRVNRNITINLFWSNCVDSPDYGQIKMNNNSYFELAAPNGYIFTSIHVEIYNTYNNLTITANSFAVDASFNTVGTRSTYDCNPNSQYIDIANRSGHATYVYSISFAIGAAS